MKAKIAAVVILVYAVFLFVESVLGTLLDHTFTTLTIPVHALIFIGPGIGVYRRVNWYRRFLGVCFALIFGYFLAKPFSGEVHFNLAYPAFLIGCGLPVYLLFFYQPLKEYTQSAQKA